MASVLDVATYIMNKKSPMTAMKLQKLVYYAQAWSLVWDEKPLFKESIEAWANGPVCPALYNAHRGKFEVKSGDFDGNPEVFSQESIETIDSILEHYGSKSAQWLSDLTHREDPWKDARKGLDPGDRGSKEITHPAMAEYYESLT